MNLFGLNPYLAAGVALVLAVALSFGGCEHLRAQAAVSRAELAESSERTLLEAAKTNGETIETMKHALAQWKGLGRTPQELALLAEQTSWYAEKLAGTMTELSKLKEKDRALLPECVALLRQSMQRACPGIARGLRSTASGRDENADSRSAGAGSSATSERTHFGLRAEVPIPAG